MKTMKLFSIGALLAATLAGAGCGGETSGVRIEAAASPVTAAADAKEPAKNGAEIWAQQCNRCHYARSPSSYNDAQWDVAVMHMRVRAKLTGDDYRAVLAFLKSGRQ
jgi:cytochrome c5